MSATNWIDGEGISDYWRLPEELTVKQVALLIVGIDPASEIGANCEAWKPEERPRGYDAAKQGISSGLIKGSISGRHIPVFELDINGNQAAPLEGTTDIDASLVDRESIKQWLATRGFRTGFFFPDSTDDPDYLNATNPRYAPKLAAAVCAWQAVTDPSGKHPKQALVKWLREHAVKFSLTDADGKPNETGIEEVAKVANWQPGGGAPRTPSG